jgi:hypothetical protein
MKIKNKELPLYKILVLSLCFSVYPLFLTAHIIWESHIWQDKQLVRSRSDLTSCNISVLVVVIATVTVGGTGLEVRETGNCNITVSCCSP